MTKTLAIVGARLNSSRLPGKHLMRFSGEPLITHLWRRLTHCREVDISELATTSDIFNRPLLTWAKTNNVPCEPFDGDVNDLMARLDTIIQRQDPDYILYICGDCPLIDPDFIDHALAALKGSKKDSVNLKKDVATLHEGLHFYSRRGWEKLKSISQCQMSREHVGYADKLTPILDYLSISDSANYSKITHRMSVDTQADFRFMSEIYLRWFETHDPNSIVSLAWVQQQLIEDPKLLSINGHVHQKAPKSQYEKAAIYCHLGKSIGIGHFKRAEIIANALKEYLGMSVTVNIHSDDSQIQTKLSSVRWYNDESNMLVALAAESSQLVILDLHPDFINLQKFKSALNSLKGENNKFVGIDKLDLLLPELDLLYIPSFFSIKTDPKISYGWENYLFPKKLVQQNKKKKQILVLTGGSDALNYGHDLPTELSKIETDWPIIWIQGPLSKPPNINSNSKIHVFINPANIHDLIAESEIIISCYGLSLFESIFNQAATVLLPPQHLCTQIELNHLTLERCCVLAESVSDAVRKSSILIHDINYRKKLQLESYRVFERHKGLSTLTNQLENILRT